MSGDGAWAAQYAQSFPDFDKNALEVYAAPSESATSWSDITLSCVVGDTRITTPFTSQTDQFYLKAMYGSVQSNTITNIPDSPLDHIEVDEELYTSVV